MKRHLDLTIKDHLKDKTIETNLNFNTFKKNHCRQGR